MQGQCICPMNYEGEHCENGKLICSFVHRQPLIVSKAYTSKINEESYPITTHVTNKVNQSEFSVTPHDWWTEWGTSLLFKSLLRCRFLPWLAKQNKKNCVLL